MRIWRGFNIGIHCKLSHEGCKSFLGRNDHWGGEIWLRSTARDSAGVGGLLLHGEIRVEKMWVLGV